MRRRVSLAVFAIIASIFAVALAVCQETPPGPSPSAKQGSPNAAKADEKSLKASNPDTRSQKSTKITEGLSDGIILKTIVYTLLITVLISLIEVPARSKATFRAALTSAFWLYASILGVGNSASALLVSVGVGVVSWPETALPFFYAFIGVFAFQGVMSNTNLTFFDKGVLTIQDWIDKARGFAVDVAVQNQVRRLNDQSQALAMKLYKNVPEAQLNAHIARHLGTETLARIKADATAVGADEHFYKALEFAT